jgi:hypothetical protein
MEVDDHDRPGGLAYRGAKLKAEAQAAPVRVCLSETCPKERQCEEASFLAVEAARGDVQDALSG